MESWGGALRNTVGSWFGGEASTATQAAPAAAAASTSAASTAVPTVESSLPSANYIAGPKASVDSGVDGGMGELTQLVSGLKAQVPCLMIVFTAARPD
jgi:hypothetical protein